MDVDKSCEPLEVAFRDDALPVTYEKKKKTAWPARCIYNAPEV